MHTAANSGIMAGYASE